MNDIRTFTERIKIWAKSRQDLRAVIIIGSQARQQQPADEFSDLDLVLFCSDAAVYAKDAAWMDAIGTPWLAVRSTTGRGDPEWDVVFEDGIKVDFVFSRYPEDLRTAPLISILEHSPYTFVYARGVRVLFDREIPASEGKLLSFPPQSYPNPTAEEFSQTVQRFFLQALRAARFLRRGELWRAARLINGGIKDPHLSMLEWHARCTRQPVPDTWYEGHFLEQWADSRAIHELSPQFAACEPGALWKALFASLESFRWTARQTAGRLGLVYPEIVDAHITREIESLRDHEAFDGLNAIE